MKNDQTEEEGKVFKVVEHVYIPKCQNKLNCSYQISVYSMVATLSGKSGKTKKNDKSPEKSGENGGFRKKVMKSQEI